MEKLGGQGKVNENGRGTIWEGRGERSEEEEIRGMQKRERRKDPCGKRREVKRGRKAGKEGKKKEGRWKRREWNEWVKVGEGG